jgi:hypothetical protein
MKVELKKYRYESPEPMYKDPSGAIAGDEYTNEPVA